MWGYVAQRLFMLVPLLFMVSVLTFFVLRVIPGDAAVAKGGLGATPEQVEEIRREMGLDKPYFPISFESALPFVKLHSDSQYKTWIEGVARGDFGQSTTFQSPVEEEILDRLPVTVELIFLSGVLMLFLGIPAGVLAAVRHNSVLDYSLRTVSVFGLSIPAFWLGTMLLLLPAIWFNWAPPTEYKSFWESPSENLKLFVLPAFALALAPAMTVMRLTRAAVLDVLANDYVRTAWAKGLHGRQVVVRHVLKNAMIPVTSYVGIQLLVLIGGAVIIERLFNLDGVGELLFTGVFSRDYALVQALVLMTAAVVLLVNLAIDLSYSLLDPRVRLA